MIKKNIIQFILISLLIILSILFYQKYMASNITNKKVLEKKFTMERLMKNQLLKKIKNLQI